MDIEMQRCGATFADYYKAICLSGHMKCSHETIAQKEQYFKVMFKYKVVMIDDSEGLVAIINHPM